MTAMTFAIGVVIGAVVGACATVTIGLLFLLSDPDLRHIRPDADVIRRRQAMRSAGER